MKLAQDPSTGRERFEGDNGDEIPRAFVYQFLSYQQKDVCAICCCSNKNKRRFCIDHCHKTGRVRGLLCSECNFLLGCAQDNPEMLMSAIQYLESELYPGRFNPPKSKRMSDKEEAIFFMKKHLPKTYEKFSEQEL